MTELRRGLLGERAGVRGQSSSARPILQDLGMSGRTISPHPNPLPEGEGTRRGLGLDRSLSGYTEVSGGRGDKTRTGYRLTPLRLHRGILGLRNGLLWERGQDARAMHERAAVAIAPYALLPSLL